MAERISDVEKERVLELLDSGKSIYAVSKMLNRSRASVSKIAQEIGHGPRKGQKLTPAQKVAKQKATDRRQELKEKLLNTAHSLVDQLNEPCTVYSFGGKDNTYSCRLLDKPPPKESKDLMSAAGVAIGRMIDLERRDDEATQGGQAGALLMLFRAMGLKTDDETDDGE